LSREVTINIKTIQTDSKGNSDDIELVTRGDIYEEDGVIYVVYEETELSGMEGTTTTLKIFDNQVVLKRLGQNTSDMIFEKGKRFKTKYKTFHGDISMELLTTAVDVNVDKKQCKVDVDIAYDINISGVFEGKNKMNIRIS